MIEWILVVWLVVGGVAVPGFEIGVYYDLEACVEASLTVKTGDPDASFVAICVPRPK